MNTEDLLLWDHRAICLSLFVLYPQDSSLDGLESPKAPEPFKILHKEQDIITAFAINQVGTCDFPYAVVLCESPSLAMVLLVNLKSNFH